MGLAAVSKPYRKEDFWGLKLQQSFATFGAKGQPLAQGLKLQRAAELQHGLAKQSKGWAAWRLLQGEAKRANGIFETRKKGAEAATVLHPWGQKAKLWRPLVQGQEPTRRPEDARKVELLCGHARQRKGLQRTMTVFFGVRNVQNGSAESLKKGKFWDWNYNNFMVGDKDGATTNVAGAVPPRPRLGRGRRISYVKIYV